MPRAQCLVCRGNKVLLVRHNINGHEHWCLPGGGIEHNELPFKAALRELKEECNVRGDAIRETSALNYGDDDITYTFLVDIGNQKPTLGRDPELDDDDQVLVDVQWLALNELSEKQRAYLWAAGLMGVPAFFEEMQAWGEDVSYPGS